MSVKCAFIFSIFSLNFRFKFDGSRRWWDGGFMYANKRYGLDRPGDRAEEAQAILKNANTRARERIPLQCVRFQAEAMGTSEGSTFD